MTAGRCEIVIINGSGTAGKDETIRHASRLLAGIHSVYNMSTIETVKQACRNFFGVDPEHDKTDAKRRFWSAVKAAWVQYNNGPFLEMQKMIEVLDAHHLYGDPAGRPIVFIHVREPDEIYKFKRHYGARCHRLLVRNKRARVPDTTADRNVESGFYDYLIENNADQDELCAKVQAFLREILGPDVRFNHQTERGT
jgi:hypothetical protein